MSEAAKRRRSYVIGYLLGLAGTPVPIWEEDNHQVMPGLYETGTTTLKTSWADLLANDVVAVTDYVVKKGSNASDETLSGDLFFPVDGSVTKIGYQAFCNLTALTGVTFPSAIKCIDDQAFYDCDALTEVMIPGSVSELSVLDGCHGSWELFGVGGAFAECDGITKITIGEGVTAIGDGCFSFCNAENIEVVLPSSVTELGCMAFAWSNVTNVDLRHVKTFRHAAFQGSDLVGEIRITSDMLVEKEAFEYTDITGLTIDEGVIEIPDSCFHGCELLEGVINIPASVGSLASSAFANCHKVTRFSVDEGNQHYVDADGVLFSKDMTILMTYPGGKTDTSYVVPEGVTTLADDGAFGRNLDSGLYLTDITLPSTLAYIGKGSLYDGHIKTITILATTPPQLGENPITVYGDLDSIIVLTGYGEAYKAADGWSKYADYIKEAG